MAQRLPILTFHAVDEGRSALSFDPAAFREGLRTLFQAGYRTMPLIQVRDCLRMGQFPDQALVITFDDGFRSVYQAAFPVLQEIGFTATVFLTIGHRLPVLGGRPMLSWREIRELDRAGISFGAHTLSHPDLTRLSRQRVIHELATSQRIIEDTLGKPVTTFAYPFGRYDAASRAAAAECFDLACSDRLGLVGARSDPLALERIDACYLRSRLGWLSRAWFNWYVRARAVPRNLKRSWIARWQP